MVGQDGRLLNQCSYAVDVSFCVENPRQTPGFFDSSEAFRCPEGGLGTLGPGQREGNTLNGTVHWFACATQHRGKGNWNFVPGTGYRGHCTKDSLAAAPASGAAVASARAPELWGTPYECNDWIPETPEVWKELDRATGKLMCKRANSPGAREAARAAFERERMALETAEQRKRDDAARAEQQFRASLQAMNPGQMLARADELGSQGDPRRAREVLRTMMSRFPDHPMTLIAARQLTGDTGTAGAASAAGTAGSTGGSAGGAPAPARTGRMSDQECEARKQAVIATVIPPNPSITAHQETVMFMTGTALEMIDRGCPGGTPAQRAAERQSYARNHAEAEQACNQAQSGGRRCVARNHFGPGSAPSAGGQVTPYPRIPVPRF